MHRDANEGWMPDESIQEGEFFMDVTSISMTDFVPTHSNLFVYEIMGESL